MRKLVRRLRRLLSPTLRRPDLLEGDEHDAAIDFAYRFLLARPVDDEGRANYLRRMRDEGMSLREVAAEIAASDEFQARLRATIARDRDVAAGALPQAEAFVEAQALSAAMSVEALARTADDYYRTTLQFSDRYLAKPFADPRDAPDLLGSFAQLLAGLHLVPGMTVLDFGAGACWTTRCLTQLGCAAIALDVSPTALELGRQLYTRLPPIGDCPPPRFLVFDGRRIDVPDAGVDRVFCFDAFHHVPNPAEVMVELGRVLRPGGIAGFSEPGRHHSKGARSQYEMKNYTAIENDVVMEDVWTWARAAGFAELELAVFSTESYRVPLKEFEEATRGGRALDRYAERVRVFLHGHQTFFLRKSGGREGQPRARRAERRDHRAARADGRARRRADSRNRHRAERRQRELASRIDAGGRRQSRRTPARARRPAHRGRLRTHRARGRHSTRAFANGGVRARPAGAGRLSAGVRPGERGRQLVRDEWISDGDGGVIGEVIGAGINSFLIPDPRSLIPARVSSSRWS